MFVIVNLGEGILCNVVCHALLTCKNGLCHVIVRNVCVREFKAERFISFHCASLILHTRFTNDKLFIYVSE